MAEENKTEKHNKEVEGQKKMENENPKDNKLTEAGLHKKGSVAEVMGDKGKKEHHAEHAGHEHEEHKHTESKASEVKPVLEREYVVPLRKEWLKVPTYKRANKAVKALKEFMTRHMKIYDRDLRKVKIDILLNNEIRFRGMRYPPAKIRVKAIKNEDGTVNVKLVELPKHIEFEIARRARKEAEKAKKTDEKSESKEEKAAAGEKKEGPKETAEEGKEKKEKEQSSKEAELKLEKKSAKQMKHTAGMKKAPIIQRKALQK